MNIKLNLNDEIYALLQSGKRIQGSIGLAEPRVVNFNMHRLSHRAKDGAKWIKLPHGSASVTDEKVNLTLRINRSKCDIPPYRAIDIESCDACDFVYTNL